MSGFLRSRKILICGLFPSFTVDDADLEKFKEARGLYIKDPWTRVKTIFSKDNYGNFHPELINAFHATQFGAVGGGIFGGILESMVRVQNFIRTNDTNVYSNQRELYKTLSNVHLLSFIKGTFKWAPCCAIFCGSFTLISTCCEFYRSKPSIIDNTIAGALVGALVKCFFGIKGMISGGIVGGLLGTTYGITQWSLLKLSNIDHIHIKYANFAYIVHKKEKMTEFNNPSENVFDKMPDFFTSRTPDPLNEITAEKDSDQENNKNENDINV